MKTYRIAVLSGDGIGPEVIAQAVRVLEAVGERFAIRFALDALPVRRFDSRPSGDYVRQPIFDNGDLIRPARAQAIALDEPDSRTLTADDENGASTRDIFV